MKKNIVILKTGETLPNLLTKRGDFEDWILEGMELKQSFSKVVSVFQGEHPPSFDQISGIAITGSHQPVMDKAEWSEWTAGWLLEAVQESIPILGICFGHQLLGYALGGKIADTPNGPEYGTIQITLTKSARSDPLFQDLPGTIEVQSSHYQAVIELPQNTTLLGSSPIDPRAAFRYGSCAWGVQFHPEFDAEITKTYLHQYRERIEKSSGDINHILRSCRDTTDGKTILRNFARYCGY
jgi:GMP synthase (glutamine-hydrolysing)